MGHYIDLLLEPLKGQSKANLLKNHEHLRQVEGIGDWLAAKELALDQTLDQQNYLVLDIETSGFNPATDAILSVGFVPIDKGRINLAQAQHYYVSDAPVVSPDSAVINHITPQMLTQGQPLTVIMTHLFQALQDRVPIAHGCWMEQQFLEHASRELWQLSKLPLQWLDTLKIEKARIGNGCVSPHKDVRLASIRQRYQLPEYQAHNALYDAIATAELYLVLIRAIYGKAFPSLKAFYSYQQKAKMAM